jgi:hypothetical protein
VKRLLISTIPLAAALAAGSVVGAFAAEQPGHNRETRALEAAFKVAQYERAGSADGCYAPPATLAAKINEKTGQTVLIARGPKQVRRRNIVHILRGGTHCNRLRMGLRGKSGLYLLDSATGLLDLVGRKRHQEPAGQAGPLRAIGLVQKAFTISVPEDPERFSVLCPKGKFPLGGGMSATPAPAPDGEGAYPHSYERLGAQRGWHVNPVLIDPSPATTFPVPSGGTTPRNVRLQVVCAKGLVPDSSPHKTVFTKSGETESAIARCPKGQVLMSGGFQRTNFVRFGGNYITESRAVGTRAWKVTATGFGSFGGELTSIAYCTEEKKPLLTTVSSSAAPVPNKQLVRATTPACPKGLRLTAGGFSLSGSNALFGDGVITKRGTWTTTAFGYFGAAPSLRAYGYCLRPGVTD